MLLKKVKSLWPIFILPLLLLLFFGDTLVVLHRTWIQWDQSYSHGYLIVALFLFWTTRETLKQGSFMSDRTAALALACFLGTLFAWYAGRVMQVRLLEQLAVVSLAWCYCWTLGGYRYALKLLAPFLILLLAIPLWDVAISPLQDMTVAVVTRAVELMSIAAYIEGNRVSLPYGDLVIADGCAGLNLFLVGLSVGVLYSYLNLLRVKSVLFCVGILLALGIITNWIRVFALVLIGYYSEMQSSLVEDHGSFGWLIFTGVLVSFFWLYRVVEKPPQPWLEFGQSRSASVWQPYIWVMLVALGLTYWWVAEISESPGSFIGEIEKSHWEERAYMPAKGVPWKPMYSGYDLEQHREMLGIPNAYFSRYLYYGQEQGKELVYYSNRIADKYDTELLTVDGAQFTVPVNVARIRDNGKTYVVVWTYRVGRWFTASEVSAKLLQLPASISAKRSAELLVFTLPCVDGDVICDREVGVLQDVDAVAAFNAVIAAIQKH